MINKGNNMEISKKQFLEACSISSISKNSAEAIWASLEANKENSKNSVFTKLILYCGAIIVILAMTWFMGITWGLFGGGGMFFIASLYVCVLLAVGFYLQKKQDLSLPAGLLATAAVSIVPLAVYGLEEFFGFVEDTNYFYPLFLEGHNEIPMELGTFLVGLFVLRFFPFAFLTVPIIISAWLFAIDLFSWLYKNDFLRGWVSISFGLLLLAFGISIDRKTKEDFSFWCYFFGASALWLGLMEVVWDKNEWIIFIFFLINVIMMVSSILLQRTIFLVLGAIGVIVYLGHLSYEVFKDSILFPFALSGIGLLLIYLGVLYQRNYLVIERWIFNKIPSRLKKYFIQKN
jgi:hypothetical protein